MKAHGGFFWANIILGIILTLIVAADIIIGMSLYFSESRTPPSEESDMDWNIEGGSKEQAEYSQWDYQWYTRMKVEKAEAKLLGNTHKGTKAEAGYQFYEVNLQVKNEGTMSGNGIYTSFEETGNGDVKVYIKEEDSHYKDIEYSNYEVIPAAQSGTVTQVIQVRKGIKKLNMTYSDDVVGSGVCRIKLPQ